ncbi:related to glucose regulated stress protein, HSP70-like [Serendipita indica DSM 11827]|uniref:Related to glucose regulated stress protein, HSP70-like n=1 Tax=Serendipita indica (strain DSM 11827) TaxID=1109443 RepID=G4T592_SERID|nr:related to glucose regulated stress protein, HSP70-like [Serendipita indica DSM 11827]
MSAVPSHLHRLFLFLVLFFPTLISASVLAIDYGSDFTKVSLMKPGVPFDVVLNRDSKRKIASSVAWKGEERLFGADAVNIAPRFPSASFGSLKLLQGAQYSSAPSQFHALLYPYLKVSEVPARGTHSFVRKEGEEWTNEELVAMQFGYVKDLAESVAGERVRDAVVTVPAWYSQYERQAVLDSLALAGLRGLSLVNDGTAIAVNFAMSRTFPNLEHHIIYDAGAASLRATLVSFHTVTEPISPKSKKTADVTYVSVKGYGYDRVATGSEMDYRLRELLRGKFEAAHMKGKSLKSEHRAIAKLWKEASRVKTILSANTESRVSIESFHNDIDFRTSVARTEFEEACADLNPRFTQPIIDALEQADISIKDVSSIILAGGVSRVPMVQSAIKFTFGENKIAHNVNADEAAVLGAAFYGASLSKQFKTKDIRVEDRALNYLDVMVSYVAESKTGGQRTIQTSILPAKTVYGAKKTMTFKRNHDFNITISYKDADNLDIPPHILEAEIIGVADAVANLTSRGAVDPLVKVSVGMSDSGMITLHDAFVYGEVKEETVVGKLKNLFGGSSSSSSSASDHGETATVSEPSSSSTASSEEPTTTEVKSTPSQVPLEIATTYLSIIPYTADEISEARKRLIAVDTAERLRHKKEEARNMLEGYLYRLRDLLEGEETSPFMLFSKPDERKKLEEKMWDNFRWINEEAESADIKELWSRRDDMEAIEKPIQFRYEEDTAAPRELENLQQALHAGQAFLQSAHQNYTMEDQEGISHRFTLEELEDVKNRLKETADWLESGITEQKKLAKNDDPVLISAEMKARGVTLQNHVLKMSKRKFPKPPVKKDKPKEEKEGEKEKGEPKEEPKITHQDL